MWPCNFSQHNAQIFMHARMNTYTQRMALTIVVYEIETIKALCYDIYMVNKNAIH